MSYSVVTRTPSAPSGLYFPHLADLIDIDAAHPQWVQKPRVQIEIHNPKTGAVYAHTISSVDSLIRQNSFTQRSQTVDLVLHDVVDWLRPAGTQPFHSLFGVTVYEGYGGMLQQTFNGVITDADYSDAPHEVRLTCSDRLYFADSFFILSPLYYGGTAAEDAVRDLLARCGIDSAWVNIGYDGAQSFYCPPLPQTDGTKGRNGAFFSYETMNAALTHLVEMYGYSYWCDVSGYIEFQYVRPFPQAAPVSFPYQTTRLGGRYPFRVMGAQDANAYYATTGLPGNLLKVVSYKLSAHNMRNFVGVSNGADLLVYKSAAPTIAGWPAPVAPFLSAGGVATWPSLHNTAELPYYTVAALFANDLVNDVDAGGTPILVKKNPDNPADSTTTTLSDFLSSRMLSDLNREAMDLEFVTWGNPFVDLGQTCYVKDHNVGADGMFFITGYQSRFSASSGGGYTCQIKANGGPTWTSITPRPRPIPRGRQMATGDYIASMGSDAAWTASGLGTVTTTPSTGPY